MSFATLRSDFDQILQYNAQGQSMKQSHISSKHAIVNLRPKRKQPEPGDTKGQIEIPKPELWRRRHYFRAFAAPEGGSQEKTWRGRRHASVAPKHVSSSASLRHHRHPLRAAQSPRVARSRHGGSPPRPDPPLLLLAPAAAAAAPENAPALTRRSSASRAADLAPAIFGCSSRQGSGLRGDSRMRRPTATGGCSPLVAGGGLDETRPCSTARPNISFWLTSL